MKTFESLLTKVRACNLCETNLPLGPRPIVQLHPNAKILIVGQAPGKKVHLSGVPFDDASGSRLRDWMGVTKEQFYNSKNIAILPMGFCYPGTGKSGDLPPRPECAPAWRELLLGELNQLKITLVLGQYAQAYHFEGRKMSVTARVEAWQASWPTLLALPHPSPRNNIWLRRNPWFETEVIPLLQKRVAETLKE
ncbi:MAG: uracil-DNA glycosylase [Enterobacterales bacterium]|jgi:uracil-DNA glycosylase